MSLYSVSKGLLALHAAQVPSHLLSNALKCVEAFELQVWWCVATKPPHFKIYLNTVLFPQLPHSHVSLWAVPALLSLLPLPFHLCVPSEGFAMLDKATKVTNISVLCHGCAGPRGTGEKQKGLCLCASPIQWQGPRTVPPMSFGVGEPVQKPPLMNFWWD